MKLNTAFGALLNRYYSCRHSHAMPAWLFCVLLSVLLASVSPAVVRAEEPSFLWAKVEREYAMYDPVVCAIASDRQGNIHMTGYTYTDRGYYVEWCARYDRNGAEQFFSGYAATESPYQGIWPADVAVDMRSNIYAAGWSQIDPHTGIVNGPAMYLKKTAGPDAGWFREAWGAPGSVYAFAVAVDSAGSSYVSGEFSGTPANFSKTSIQSGTGPDNFLAGNGRADAFIVKYDSIGTILWLKNAGGTNDDLADGIGVDSSGNCYVTGTATGPASFDSLTLANSGGFLAKYSPAGAALWVRNVERGSLKVDPAGNSYLAGPTGLAKYNANGQLVWNVPSGAASDLSLSRDNVFTTGGGQVRKYSPQGQLAWSFDLDGPMTVDYWGDVYCSSVFTVETTIAGTDLTTRWKSTYLAKLGSDILRLSIARSGSSTTVSWPTNAAGFTLTTSTTLNPPAWSAVTTPRTVQGDRFTVSLPASSAAQFYRLEGN